MINKREFINEVYNQWAHSKTNGVVYGFIDIVTNEYSSLGRLYQELDESLSESYMSIMVSVQNSRKGGYLIVRPSDIVEMKQLQEKHGVLKTHKLFTNLMGPQERIMNWQTFKNKEGVLKNSNNFDASQTFIFQYEFDQLEPRIGRLRIMRLDDLIESYLQFGEIPSGVHRTS